MAANSTDTSSQMEPLPSLAVTNSQETTPSKSATHDSNGTPSGKPPKDKSSSSEKKRRRSHYLPRLFHRRGSKSKKNSQNEHRTSTPGASSMGNLHIDDNIDDDGLPPKYIGRQRSGSNPELPQEKLMAEKASSDPITKDETKQKRKRKKLFGVVPLPKSHKKHHSRSKSDAIVTNNHNNNNVNNSDNNVNNEQDIEKLGNSIFTSLMDDDNDNDNKEAEMHNKEKSMSKSKSDSKTERKRRKSKSKSKSQSVERSQSMKEIGEHSQSSKQGENNMSGGDGIVKSASMREPRRSRTDSLTSMSRELVDKMEQAQEKFTKIPHNIYADPSQFIDFGSRSTEGGTEYAIKNFGGGKESSTQFVLTGTAYDTGGRQKKTQFEKIIVKDDNQIEKLIFLVNTQSGGKHGAKFIKLFQKYDSIIYDLLKCTLNPEVLHDLANDIARLGDRTVCIMCGGDGSQHWAIQTIGKALKWLKVAKGETVAFPKVAPFPIGTGNDLSRAVGWGNLERTDEKIIKYISDVYFTYGVSHRMIGLDRWKISWHFPMLKQSITDAVPPSPQKSRRGKNKNKNIDGKNKSGSLTLSPPQNMGRTMSGSSDSTSTNSLSSPSLSEATRDFMETAKQEYNHPLEDIDEKKTDKLKMTSLSNFDEDVPNSQDVNFPDAKDINDRVFNPSSSSDENDNDDDKRQAKEKTENDKDKDEDEENEKKINEIKIIDSDFDEEDIIDAEYGGNSSISASIGAGLKSPPRTGTQSLEDLSYKQKIREYRHSFNPPLPIGFLCYFTIGYDAIITNDFAVDRQLHPSKYKSQLGNQLQYVKMGIKDLIKPTDTNIAEYVDLYINKDYKNKISIPPEMRSLKLININSAANGMFFWGSGKSNHNELQEWDPPRCDDGKIEVCASRGVQQIVKSKLSLNHAFRLGQVSDIRFVFKKAPFAMQIDGEGFIIQEKCYVDVSLYKHKVPMLIGYKSPKGVPFQYLAESYTSYIKHQRHLYRKYKRKQFQIRRKVHLKLHTKYHIETKTNVKKNKSLSRPVRNVRGGSLDSNINTNKNKNKNTNSIGNINKSNSARGGGVVGDIDVALTGVGNGIDDDSKEFEADIEDGNDDIKRDIGLYDIDEELPTTIGIGRRKTEEKRLEDFDPWAGPPAFLKKKSVATHYIDELENDVKSEDSVGEDDENVPEFHEFAKAPYWEQIRKSNRLHLIDDITAREMRETLMLQPSSFDSTIRPNKKNITIRNVGGFIDPNAADGNGGGLAARGSLNRPQRIPMPLNRPSRLTTNNPELDAKINKLFPPRLRPRQSVDF